METQILTELQAIRQILLVIAVMLGIVIFSTIIGRLAQLPMMWIRSRESAMRQVIERLGEKGEPDEMFDYLKRKEEKLPRSALVKFYLGKSEYDRENYQESKVYFDQVSQLEPSWEKEIAPYLERIDGFLAKK